MKSEDSEQRSDPEPLTQSEIIEELLEELNYNNVSPEAGDKSEERGNQADYAISINNSNIESERLLIEAEPINKKLRQSSHGVGQVKDWLDQRRFEADFGIATDGLKWILIRYDSESYTYDTVEEINLAPVFLEAFENITGKQQAAKKWVTSHEDLLREFLETFEYGNFQLIASDAPEIIKQKKEKVTQEFYQDYVKLVFGVSEGDRERISRSLTEDGITCDENISEEEKRIFAVRLMNRLIFTKFLEDKGLVEEDLLKQMKDQHNEQNIRSMYEIWLEPFFFDILDSRKEERTESASSSMYGDAPYLNGGLFRSENGAEGVSDEDFDVRNSVLYSIIDLLERYDFSTDGGPEELDPSVLGRVFEKTINYITTENADDKDELGAYYTPDEITSYCAEETIQPLVLERFKETIVTEWGWKEADVRHFDDVHTLIDNINPVKELIELLIDELNDLRVLDPACGSGHFLTSTESEITKIRKSLRDKLHEDTEKWRLNKRTVIENIYGVDIMRPAVEIAKLRLWLSIISEVDSEKSQDYEDGELALPNVLFNIRQGNSLIGFTGLAEEEDIQTGQMKVTSWGSDTIRKKYSDIIHQIQQYKNAETTEEAKTHLKNAKELLEEYKPDLNEKTFKDFEQAGIDVESKESVEQLDPFHWVLEFAEVYADGGFDAIIGNPPWDRLTPLRDDFFSRYDPDFRTYLPEEKNNKQEGLLENEKIRQAWNEYKDNIEKQSNYFKNSGNYELQSPEVAGRTRGTESDLSSLFLERVFQIARDDSYIAQVLPGAIFNGLSTKDLRMHLLNQTEIKSLVTFENKGIFPEIDNRYNFGVLVAESGGRTKELHGTFLQRSLEILEHMDQRALDIPRRVLAEYSPKARIFPYVDRQKEVDALNKILEHEPIAERESGKWYVHPYRELDRTNDSDRFVENKEKGDYPVYGGSNVFQFVYDDSYFNVDSPEFWSVDEEKDPEKSAKQRIRSKNLGNLKKAIYEEFDGSGSMKGFVNNLLIEKRGKELSEGDVVLDMSEYRIVYRDIARSSDERTMIASVIPKGVACHNKLHAARPYNIEPEKKHINNNNLEKCYERVFTDEELFVALGLMNSLPFDFLMRTKVDSTVVMYKFKESQVPKLEEGSKWFKFIWKRAAKLNCYGKEFGQMRERLNEIEPIKDVSERKRTQAEIDAASFKAYGLDRDQTKFILEDFDRVSNPRVMTDEYFDEVLEKYDEISPEN